MQSNAILTATVVLLSSSLVTIRADAAVCRAADSVSADLIFRLRRYASAASGDNKVVRDSLHLPFTTSLSLITSESVCKKAPHTTVARPRRSPYTVPDISYCPALFRLMACK